jgi:hypothetical protein
MDITNVSYLAFRMAPFIIVSFFVLQSLLNWNLKGIIYLAGLLFCTAAIYLVDGSIGNAVRQEVDSKCSIISLGANGDLLFKTPLSLAVYCYTFFYLLIFIFNLGNRKDNKGMLGKTNSTDLNTAFQQNIPTMIIFPLLIILEIWWLTLNKCIQDPPHIFIITSIAIGSVIGVLWGIMITSLKNPNLMYLSKDGVEVCSRPSKTYFSCKKASRQ